MPKASNNEKATPDKKAKQQRKIANNQDATTKTTKYNTKAYKKQQTNSTPQKQKTNTNKN